MGQGKKDAERSSIEESLKCRKDTNKGTVRVHNEYSMSLSPPGDGDKGVIYKEEARKVTGERGTRKVPREWKKRPKGRE